ncbi:MAG: hypothetical protein IJ229_01585 [Clostridia bacterium]|nr:hypothetical protein [Clostridia bacterium]MBR1686542.1 hypothetical protein [Clostridia bacterium]MBR2288961.1 hypothetical protein [Clostridia bacterium]
MQTHFRIRKAVSFLLTLVCILALGMAHAIEGDQVDLDLTQMSEDEAYEMLDNIFLEPEDYLGMTIRMSGTYDVYEDPYSGRVYHSCLLSGPADCCGQGIEFVMAEEAVEDLFYGDAITVTGKLAEYDEDGYAYLHLVDTVLIRAEETAKPEAV